jgi:hypothetical protein
MIFGGSSHLENGRIFYILQTASRSEPQHSENGTSLTICYNQLRALGVWLRRNVSVRDPRLIVCYATCQTGYATASSGFGLG